jgi:hypothetical protein
VVFHHRGRYNPVATRSTGPLNLGGTSIRRDADAVADFVLNSNGSVEDLSVVEKTEVLKVLSHATTKAGENKSEGKCHRYQNAAIRVLKDSSRIPQELGVIGTHLGGPRWIQASMLQFTLPELKLLATQMLAEQPSAV